MDDVDDDAVGILDNAGIVVVNIAVGLLVAEEIVASQAHRSYG